MFSSSSWTARASEFPTPTGRRSPTAGQSRRRSCTTAVSCGWETRLLLKSRPRMPVGGPVRRRGEQPLPLRPLPDRHSRDRTPDAGDRPGTPENQRGQRSGACRCVRLRNRTASPAVGAPSCRKCVQPGGSPGPVCHPSVRRCVSPGRAGRPEDPGRLILSQDASATAASRDCLTGITWLNPLT